MAIIKSQGLKLLDMNNGPKKKIKKEEKKELLNKSYSWELNANSNFVSSVAKTCVKKSTNMAIDKRSALGEASGFDEDHNSRTGR